MADLSAPLKGSWVRDGLRGQELETKYGGPREIPVARFGSKHRLGLPVYVWALPEQRWDRGVARGAGGS